MSRTKNFSKSQQKGIEDKAELDELETAFSWDVFQDGSRAGLDDFFWGGSSSNRPGKRLLQDRDDEEEDDKEIKKRLKKEEQEKDPERVWKLCLQAATAVEGKKSQMELLAQQLRKNSKYGTALKKTTAEIHKELDGFSAYCKKQFLVRKDGDGTKKKLAAINDFVKGKFQQHYQLLKKIESS